MSGNVARIKKFASFNFHKITGGKDPVRLVEEFIVRLGFNPEDCLKGRNLDTSRWMIKLSERQELEVLVESIRKPQDTTIYMGVNITAVPLRDTQDVLVAALEIADGLVGIKVSLVGHYLVLSSTLGATDTSVDDIEHHYRLISAQQDWFKTALADELGWEGMPGE